LGQFRDSPTRAAAQRQDAPTVPSFTPLRSEGVHGVGRALVTHHANRVREHEPLIIDLVAERLGVRQTPTLHLLARLLLLSRLEEGPQHAQVGLSVTPRVSPQTSRMTAWIFLGSRCVSLPRMNSGDA